MSGHGKEQRGRRKSQTSFLNEGVAQLTSAGPGFRRQGGGTGAGTRLESFGRELISSRSVVQPAERACLGNTDAPRLVNASRTRSRSKAIPARCNGLGEDGRRAAAPAGSSSRSGGELSHLSSSCASCVPAKLQSSGKKSMGGFLPKASPLPAQAQQVDLLCSHRRLMASLLPPAVFSHDRWMLSVS